MIHFFTKHLWNPKKAHFEPGFLSIDQTRIAEIQYQKSGSKTLKAKIRDLGDLYVGPSAIDLHVHARDFEESHKETFDSCAEAAKKGGVSTLACMANTRPRMDSPERLHHFLKAVQKQSIRFIPFASVTKNLEGKEPTDWKTLLRMPIAGLSDDGKPILDEAILRAVLKVTRDSKKILSLHEEDTRESKGSLVHLCETSMRLGIEGSSARAESTLVERDLKIAWELKAPLHLGHISSKESVSLIRAARKRGQKVSVELTPHHALLEASQIEELEVSRWADFKVCPPIRSREDRSALQKACFDGTIDCFASDHAPHSRFEKNLPLPLAMHGLVSLEYFFTLYNELRLRTQMPWKVFYRCLSERPASLLSDFEALGRFAPGGEASFLVFDPLAEVKLGFTRSLSQNSLFEGQKFRGRVVEHWAGGKKVYEG